MEHLSLIKLKELRDLTELLFAALTEHRDPADLQLLELAMQYLDHDIIDGEFTIVYTRPN